MAKHIRTCQRNSAESHPISYIFTDFRISDPNDVMVAEEYRSTAMDRGCVFISVVLDCDVAERTDGRSSTVETDGSSETRQEGQLYRFGVPEEIEVNISRYTAEEAIESIINHVRMAMGGSVE